MLIVLSSSMLFWISKSTVVANCSLVRVFVSFHESQYIFLFGSNSQDLGSHYQVHILKATCPNEGKRRPFE